MKKLFLAAAYYGDEGTHIIGIFDTKKEAEDALSVVVNKKYAYVRELEINQRYSLEESGL